MAFSSPAALLYCSSSLPTCNIFPLSHLNSLHSTVVVKHSNNHHLFLKSTRTNNEVKWRTNVSFLPSFLNKGKDVTTLKQDLLQAISQLDRGAEATPQDQQTIDKMAKELEAVNPTKGPLKSDLLNGKWELIYTTSLSILQTSRPKFLRSRTNYQAINTDTLRAQNLQSWPFFNQVTADLTPLNARKVGVKFDYFKILGLIPVKAPEKAVGQLEITFLDEDLSGYTQDQGGGVESLYENFRNTLSFQSTSLHFNNGFHFTLLLFKIVIKMHCQIHNSNRVGVR